MGWGLPDGPVITTRFFLLISLQGLISLWVTISIISRPSLLWECPPVCIAHAIFILVHERHFRSMYPWFWYIFLPSLHSWETVLCPSAYLWHLFKYSYGRSNWRMLPAISRIYHLSCRGFFYVPCKFQAHGTSVLSLIRRTFSDQNSVEFYMVLPIYSWVKLQHQRV